MRIVPKRDASLVFLIKPFFSFSREIEVACFQYIFICWFDCTQARFDDQIEKARRKNKLQKAE